jgi:hypothetical protein
MSPDDPAPRPRISAGYAHDPNDVDDCVLLLDLLRLLALHAQFFADEPAPHWSSDEMASAAFLATLFGDRLLASAPDAVRTAWAAHLARHVEGQ